MSQAKVYSYAGVNQYLPVVCCSVPGSQVLLNILCGLNNKAAFHNKCEDSIFFLMNYCFGLAWTSVIEFIFHSV